MTQLPISDCKATFLFTDIEGSTRLWERHPAAMREALARHDRVFTESIAASNGQVFKTVGDAFCAAFDRTSDALSAAIHAQQQLSEGDWPQTGPLRVRVAIHCGEVQRRDADYFGPTVNRVARILSAGHGGQILLSQAAHDDLGDALPDQIDLLDLASHRLKDLGQPEHLWQVLHPSLDSEFPPLRSLQAFANNIPAQISSFVGRERELGEVRKMLSERRLLTVTGPGGCGKTRLALQAAADAVELFGDGAWLVELAAIADPSLVVQQAATALGLRESPDVPLEDALLAHLQTKKLLLVIDNCEQVIDESARLVEQILNACPGVIILCTSREPLGIPGEQSWTIPSMPLPVAAETDLQEDATASLLEYDSIRLFVERSRETAPAFVFSAGNAAAVAAICRRLDGIPLAIELAAAATRALNPKQISERLDDRFRLLTGGRRTASERQRTLRGAIEWSYDLLTEKERALVTRLSIFVGGWTLEAAEEVCSGDGIDRYDVVDLLGRLVSKSLVIAHDGPAGLRYGMLESIRQYSDEKRLAAPETERRPLAVRHVEWYAGFSTRAAREFRGGDVALWIERMEVEHENIRSALEQCRSSRDLTQEALQIAGGFAFYWYTRGHASEGLRFAQTALMHPDAQAQNANRALALNAAGALTMARGQFQDSHGYYQEVLSIRRLLNDPLGICGALNNLGIVQTRQGNYDLAEQYMVEGLSISREIGDKFNIANSSNNLGNIAKSKTNYDAAKAYYEECLRVSRELGHKTLEAMSLCNLGCVELDQCRFESAAELFAEGSGMNREMGDHRQVASNLPDLALAQLETGNADEALETVLEACRLSESIQDAYHHAAAQVVRASVELARGNVDTAYHICRDCLEMFVKIEDSENSARTLLILAEHAVAAGRYARAASLLAAVEAIRTKIGAPMPPRERIHAEGVISAAKAALGEEDYAESWARGSAMKVEESATFALAAES